MSFSQQIFGSASLGYEYSNEAWILSPYLRGDAAHTKLDSFSETGAGGSVLSQTT
ncbi:autotransporter domain-containing protein [Brucella pseudogrignonensis]|uniref:autotransporter domain-containing protein n=1 Tax=Brucella pseudogrignonensis TaxID=419475 RepID=UPI0038D14479